MWFWHDFWPKQYDFDMTCGITNVSLTWLFAKKCDFDMTFGLKHVILIWRFAKTYDFDITVNMHIFDELRACINGNVCVQMNECMNVYIYIYVLWLKMWFWYDFKLKHMILTWLLSKQCDFDMTFGKQMWFWHDFWPQTKYDFDMIFGITNVILTWRLAKKCDFDMAFS